MNTSTDLKDLEDRQDLQARMEAREERLPLDVLSGAVNQLMLETIHIFGGYPGKDGTEWIARRMASGFLRTLKWRIEELETKKMPEAMDALERAIISEGIPVELEETWNETTGRFEPAEAAYDSMMPESKVERCESWVKGLEEEFDMLSAAFDAALPAYEASFGQYVVNNGRSKAIDAASNPRLAALKERMDRKMKRKQPAT